MQEPQNILTMVVNNLPDYTYVAKTVKGETIEGSASAIDSTALARGIRDQSLFLVSYSEIVPKNNIIQDLFLPKMSTKELAVFCRQVSSMLSAGVPLIRALDIFYQQATQPKIKEIVRKLYEDVQRGDMFSEAMKKQGRVFPTLMLAIIEAGEASGQLDRSVERMADQFESDDKLSGKITSAMIYPTVLGLIAIGAVVLMLVVVLPIFVGIFEETGAELPAPTRMLLALSDFLLAYWPIIVTAITVLAIGSTLYGRTAAGRRAYDALLLKIPVVSSTISRVAASRFTRTMANLLSSGLPLLSTLEITSRVVANEIIGEQILQSRDDVRTGVPLSTALRRVSYFPPLVYSMLSVGEESGSVAELLERVSDYLDDEVENSVQRLLSMLEPLLMVFMAVVIGFVVISVMMPIFGVTSQIG